MFGFGILTGLLVLPLVGAAFILAQRGDQASVDSNARYAALATTIATFVLSLVAWSRFETGNPGFQMVETHGWVSDAIKFKLGVDGFSFPFIVLTAFLMPFCILASWQSVTKRVR
ncbi:MAG: NADH-quinone oxidoreductase subunit M, partial [Bosea sp. (in: a-proteobacteria)]